MKIRVAAALGKRRLDTFEAHESGLSGRLSAGCCSARQWDDSDSNGDGRRRAALDRPRRDRHKSCTHKTAGLNPAASHQHKAANCNHFYLSNLSLRFHINMY